MITSVIDAISIAIHTEFGVEYEIYTEIVEQGLVKPCFFIAYLNVNSRPKRGKRYLLENQMVIQYLTSSKEPNAEMYRVAERLNNCLECISVEGNLTRASKNKIEFFEELSGPMLNLTINYDFEVIKNEAPKEPMETFKVDTSAKGWGI